jgi:hypothetical protein
VEKKGIVASGCLYRDSAQPTGALRPKTKTGEPFPIGTPVALPAESIRLMASYPGRSSQGPSLGQGEPDSGVWMGRVSLELSSGSGELGGREKLDGGVDNWSPT